MRSMKSWKKLKGRARKRFLACLLSLSVIPMNGFTVMAATEPQDDQQPTTQVEEQVTTEEPDSTTSEEVKTTEKSKISKQETKATTKSVEESNDGKVSFAEESTTVKIGHFQMFKFNGVNSQDIAWVDFKSEDSSKLDIKIDRAYEYKEDGDYDVLVKKYVPVAKEVGKTKVSAVIHMEDGSEKYVPETEFTVEEADTDVVPLTSYDVYNALRHGDDVVDEDCNGEISFKEIKNASSINLYSKDLKNEDLNGLEYAVNCTDIDLGNNTEISNISFVKNMTKLESIDLADTEVSDISCLEGAKESLEEVTFPETVSFAQRIKLLKNTSIELMTGSKKIDPVRPRSLFYNCPNIQYGTDSDQILKVSDDDEKGLILESLGDVTDNEVNLVITDKSDDTTIKIPIKIKKKEEIKDIGFEKTEANINVGYFGKIPIKYNDNYDLELTSSDEEALGVYQVGKYDEDDNYQYEYYFEPHKVEKDKPVNICATYTDEDGNVYTYNLKVTVSEIENGIVPLKSYRMYSKVYKDGESADVNGDGKISYQELQNADERQWQDCDLKDEDIAVLSNAVNCETLYLYENYGITDIGFISNMKKLKRFDIDNTNVKDISALKDKKEQLTRFYPSKHISFSERLEFIKDISYINTEKDEIDDIYDLINPYGILAQLDDYKVTSSNPEIVEVWKEEEDYYVDVKKGQEGKVATLTITSGGISKTIKVVITDKDGNLPIENIMINKSSLSLNPGQNDQLSVSYLPDFAMNRTVTWTSSNNAVASVDANGKVTANAAGTAVITATTANGKTAQCTVTVTNPPAPQPQVVKVSKISIKGISTKIAAGKKVKLTANVTPNNASNKSVTWTTSNKKVATVNASGVVSVNKKAGGKTVTITATAKDGSGKKATYNIKVMKGVVKKVKISGKKSVKAGKTLSLKAKVTASKGANKKLIWTSSNTKYATVSASGKVKAAKTAKKKSVKITAMATDGSGKKATMTIKIK